MHDASSLNPSLPSTTSTPIVLPGGAATQVTLQIEPSIKEVILLQAIQGAQKSIWAEMYEFTDPDVARALDQQARNNIDVQVLYYWDPHNPRMQSMQTALHGVAPAGQQFPAWAQVNQARHTNGTPIQICHAKFMLIDAGTANQQAFLMTANFTESALAWEQPTTTASMS